MTDGRSVDQPVSQIVLVSSLSCGSWPDCGLRTQHFRPAVLRLAGAFLRMAMARPSAIMCMQNPCYGIAYYAREWLHRPRDVNTQFEQVSAISWRGGLLRATQSHRYTRNMKLTGIYGSPIHIHGLHTIQYLYFIFYGCWWRWFKTEVCWIKQAAR